LKPIKKCVQTYFLVRKLMKLICNRLGNENQHMLNNKSSKKNKKIVRTYLTPIWNEKPTVKSKCWKLLVFWKTYSNLLKLQFEIWKSMHINVNIYIFNDWNENIQCFTII